MLVGRESEQHTIARLVAGVRVGQSDALVLTGEAGIGKTSLLDDAVSLAEGMRVLRAAGSETEQDVAFAGLHQLLLPVLDSLAAREGPQAEVLQVALGLRPGRTAGRFAVGAAVLGLLSRLAEDRPILLVVDDAYLWDRSSAEALAFVGRRLLVDRIGLLAGSRHRTGSPLLDGGLPQLPVTGLSLESVSALMSAPGQAPVDPDLAARLHRFTSGNPLAVVELAGDLDALNRLSPHSPPPVPEALREVFLRRVAELSPPTRSMLLVAAIADGDLAVAQRAAEHLDLRDADLGAAEAVDLVRLSTGRVTFRHPLTRASVYAAAAAGERRRTHRAVARALPESDLERRAWHLCEASIGVDDDVAARLVVVGERARDRSAHAVAATAFEKAALLSSNVADQAPRFLAAGEAAWLAGQVERAESLLGLARERTADPAQRAEIDGLRGNIALRAGSVETARTVLLAAAEDLGRADPDAATMLLGDAVTACLYLADADGGLEAVRRIDLMLARCASQPARIRGNLTAGMAQVLAGTGGADRIREAVETLLALPALADDQVRPAWMVLGPLFLRESDTGRELVHHAVRDLRAHCALVMLPNLLFHTARDGATTHHWEAAVTDYGEGIALARESGQSTDLTMCLAGLAWVQARMGGEAASRRNATEALDLAGRHDIHFARIWSLFALGELELGLGRPEPALGHLEALDRLQGEIGFRDVDLSPGPEQVEALSRLGRGDEAAAVAARYHERAAVKAQPWACARAERATALTVDLATGESGFLRALELHRASPDVFEEARTQLAYGAALRRERRRVDARPQLRSALATFERLGARPWADLAAGELDATGERPHRRGDSELDLLTPQELQIARMLGQGRTTRETAAALFLSPKTVEYHLRHVYTKLGIRSRAELAGALTS